ncbi:translation initiation factor IF-3, mitochondrial [Nymphalis io]|uniref:translation initiation factor IF-3, mitochondrial n=1 Tax=Inachis io TaxID=171585 RepID=UPI00216717D7|nr:translation initiation factor IF-3, mitochondrial [Nymphalis io]
MNKLLTLLGPKRLFDCRSITTRIAADGKDVPKNKQYENRITLIGSDNSVSITDLKNAQNLSTRRDLKLVKIQDADSKTRRPVYKLLTSAQYHEEELSRRKEKKALSDSNTLKGQKLMTISSKIADHDILTGVKKMGKLLEKHYEVKVVISGDESEHSKLERIYTMIEKNLKAVGKVVQLRTKGNNMRFQMIPIKNNRDQSKVEANSGDNNNDNNKGPL